MTMLPLESTKIAYHIKKDLQSLNCINSVGKRKKASRWTSSTWSTRLENLYKSVAATLSIFFRKSSLLMARRRLIRQVNNEILPLFLDKIPEQKKNFSPLFSSPGRREIKMGKNKGRSLCSLRPRFFTETSSFLSFFNLRGSNYNPCGESALSKSVRATGKMVKKTRKRASGREERKGRTVVACVRFRVSHRSNVSSFTIAVKMEEDGCHREETLFTRFRVEKNLPDVTFDRLSLNYRCVRWFKKHDNFPTSINAPTSKYHPKRTNSSNWLQPKFRTVSFV